MPKNKRERLLIREKIKEFWFAGYSEREISRKMKEVHNIEISPAGVRIYLQKVHREMEFYMNEDTFDKYLSEFSRKREIFDNEVEEINQMLEMLDPKDPKELAEITKLRKLRHEIRVDSLRLLQDIQLPMAVKKFKKERDSWTKTLKAVPEEKELVLPDVTPVA